LFQREHERDKWERGEREKEREREKGCEEGKHSEHCPLSLLRLSQHNGRPRISA
jgi:hypothetical protein